MASPMVTEPISSQVAVIGAGSARLAASAAVDQARFEITYAEETFEDVNDTFLSRIAEKALSLLYSQVPINKPFNLVVRWIEPGGPESGPAQGMGDMSNALKTIRLFQQMFPTAHIFLTNKFYDNEDDTGLTEHGYLCDDFVVDRFFEGVESDERGRIQKITVDTAEKELFLGVYNPQGLREYLQNRYTDLPTVMFDVATPDDTIFPFQKEDFSQVRAPNLVSCTHVDEYNGKRTLETQLEEQKQHKWASYGIGLDQKGNPPIGIHLHPNLTEGHLRLLRCAKGLKTPFIKEWINNILKTRPKIEKKFYFGYSSEDDHGQWGRFMNAVLLHESARQNKSDVCFFFLTQGRDLILDWWGNVFKEEWRLSPFGQLELRGPAKDAKVQVRIPLNPNGTRMIRILFVNERLPNEDVKLLMQATGKAILVTGDQSWSEAVSLKDRIIFYETRSWKKDLANEMLLLARHRFGNESKITLFYEYMLDRCGHSDWGITWVAKCLAAWLLDQEFFRQHRQLMELFHQRYDARQWLVGDVTRKVTLHFEPDLEEEEEEVKNSLKRKNYREAEEKASRLFNKVMERVQKNPRDKKRQKVASQPRTLHVYVSRYRQQFVEQVKTLFAESIPKK